MPVAPSDIQKLQGTSGGPVAPSGCNSIITLQGTNISIDGNPATHTLTFSANGGISTALFVEDDGTTATFVNGILKIFGSAAQGLYTSGNGHGTIVISILDWTTTQKGVGVLATTADAIQATSSTKALTPEGLGAKLGQETAYAIPYAMGSTRAFAYAGPLTYGQLLIGTGTAPIAATLTAGDGIDIANAPGSITIRSTATAFLLFTENDGTTAAFYNNNLYLIGSVAQGLTTSGNGRDVVVFSILDWTTTQKGVGVLATCAEATTGTSSTKAVTPQGLSNKLGSQTAYAIPYAMGSTKSFAYAGPLTFGQLLIGTGTAPLAATLTAGNGIGITNASGSITISDTAGTNLVQFTENDGTTAGFYSNNLYIYGSVLQGITTSGNSYDTIVISALDWTTVQKGVGVLATCAEATTGTSSTKAVTPQGLSNKLGSQTAYAIPYAMGSTKSFAYAGVLTYGQLLIGTGTAPLAATLTAGGGIGIVNASGSITISNTVGSLVQFTENDGTTATFINNNLYIYGSVLQGITTSGNSFDTIVISALDWTTVQKGVGVLATCAEATTGTSSTKAVTPQGLSNKLGSQTAYAIPYAMGSTKAFAYAGPLTYGQLLIGTGTAPTAATLTAGAGVTITNASGAITISSASTSLVKFTENDGTTAGFLNNNLYIYGSVLQGITTSGNSYDTIVISALDWTTVQKGVGVLATSAEATTGTSTTKAVTPQGLANKLGIQTAYAVPYAMGSTKAFAYAGPLTYGQLLVGTGTAPTAATLTPGTNISIANAAGSITINATPAWSALSGNTVLTPNNGYVCTDGSPTVQILTLPVTAAQFSLIEVVEVGGGAWNIAINGGQSIIFGSVNASTALQSTANGDAIRLICVTADTTWAVLSSIGNILYS